MEQKTRISKTYAQIEEKIPDFIALPPDELVDWCISRYERLKATKGLTHQTLAEKANMPKGTVDRILAGKYRDFRYSTIQPLIAALLGQDEPVPDIDPGDHEQVEEAQELLEGYQMTLAEKNSQLPQLLSHIEKLEEAHEKRLEESRQDSQRKVDFLKAQLARKDKIITALAISLAVIIILIIAILIYDKLNPDVGWFRDMSRYFTGSVYGSTLSFKG